MLENLCGNSVGRIVDIFLTVHSGVILNIVKKIINVQWYTRNQMHPYEMSYKCQLYRIHTVATYIFVHSCHTYPQSF
jgi:hypothetical protein